MGEEGRGPLAMLTPPPQVRRVLAAVAVAAAVAGVFLCVTSGALGGAASSLASGVSSLAGGLGLDVPLAVSAMLFGVGLGAPATAMYEEWTHRSLYPESWHLSVGLMVSVAVWGTAAALLWLPLAPVGLAGFLPGAAAVFGAVEFRDWMHERLGEGRDSIPAIRRVTIPGLVVAAAAVGVIGAHALFGISDGGVAPALVALGALGTMIPPALTDAVRGAYHRSIGH